MWHHPPCLAPDRLEPEVPETNFEAADFSLDATQLGPGYGVSTAASREAQTRAAAAGLLLDGTYTAKCFAALRARASRTGPDDGPILFWNTLSSVPLTADRERPSSTAPLPGRRPGCA